MVRVGKGWELMQDQFLGNEYPGKEINYISISGFQLMGGQLIVVEQFKSA